MVKAVIADNGIFLLILDLFTKLEKKFYIAFPSAGDMLYTFLLVIT